MRQIQLSNALLTFLDELEYTEAALAADPDTVHLAPAFEEQIANFEQIARRERRARRDVTRAEAVVDVRNHQLDRLTVRFAALSLVEANSDRGDATFRRHFPVAPSDLVRMPLRKQCEHTLHVIVPDLARLPEPDPLHSMGSALQRAAEAAVQGLDARSGAKAARGAVASEVDEWKEDVNRLRLTTYASLLQIAATKRHGKVWATSFFRAPARPEADEPSDPTPAAPDADPPTD